MEKFIIQGKTPLFGTVRVNGSKNASVAVLVATLLGDSESIVDGLPDIEDIHELQKIMEFLGAKISFKHGTMKIEPKAVEPKLIKNDLMDKLRASYYAMGVLLGKFNFSETAYPGGCEIGQRPIDRHLKGFRALGADIEIKNGIVYMKAKKLKGAEIFMDDYSVGATINIMLAAVLAEGRTTIVNSSKEPHVVDTANILNKMGAKIKGAGTDTIRITGVVKLHGCKYTVIPDQIEAGTFMIAAAGTMGDVYIDNVIPKHMESLSAKLMEMGTRIEEGDSWIRVSNNRVLRSTNIKTMTYPGFPTDLQQPLSALMCLSKGVSIVNETIFETRFKHLEQLRKMGANVRIEDRIAIIEGVEKLDPAKVKATDLRAGVALVIAGMMTEGITEVYDIHHIDRGYDKIEEKLALLGGKVKRRLVRENLDHLNILNWR